MEKTNQNIFTFQNVNTSKCKIRNVRVQQHNLLLFHAHTTTHQKLIKKATSDMSLHNTLYGFGCYICKQ